jgi:hypothetical protein
MSMANLLEKELDLSLYSKDVISHQITTPTGEPFALLAVVDKNHDKDETIWELVERANWQSKFSLPTICVINGVPLKRGAWHLRVITANDNVAFWTRPGESGGSGSQSGGQQSASIGMMVGMIAATALLSFAAPGIGTALGISSTLVKAGGALLIAGGAMLMSHFLKPKTAATSTTSNSLFEITASGNQARPLEPIPVGYGHVISQPDYGTQPYSLYVGDDQILYQLFVIGCGSYYIEEIRIDDTILFDDQNGVNPAFPTAQIEILQPGQQVTLFPFNVVTASEVSGIALETQNAWIGGFIVNPSGTLATELMIDLVWPSGAYVNYKTRQLAAQTTIEAQFQPVNDVGVPIADWQPLFTKQYPFYRQSVIRVTERIPVAAGRYSVRLRLTSPRISQITTSEKISGTDDVTWNAVRATINGPNSFQDVTVVAIAETADQALSGLASRKISMITRRSVPVWNGSSWVLTLSNNPVWAALDIWSNSIYSAGLSMTRVALETFVSYANLYDQLGHEFNYFFTSETDVFSALATALGAGRAYPAFVGDRLTMVRDQPRGLPRMMFDDRNIIRGSLKVTHSFSDETYADGVVIEYLDEDVWQLQDVSSSPGLQHPTNLQYPGVTKRGQALELARYHALVNLKRRRTVQFDVELEGRMLKRGDLVSVQSSVPRSWGTAFTPVSYSAATQTIIASNDLPWDPVFGVQHYIEVRRRNGRPFGPVMVSRGVNARTVVVNQVDLGSVQASQGVNLADAIARAAGSELVSIAFSVGSVRTFRGLLLSGTPNGKNFTLSMVNDHPDVYDASGTIDIPAIPIPAISIQVIQPTISNLNARIEQRGVILVLMAGWDPDPIAFDYTAQVSLDDGYTWATCYDRGKMPSFECSVQDHDLRLRVIARTESNLYGNWYYMDLLSPGAYLNSDYITIQVGLPDFKVDLARDFGWNPAARATALTGVSDTALLHLKQVVETDDRKASIESVIQAYTTADEAIAQSLLALSSQVNDDIVAAILQEATTRADEDQALASVQTNLTTVVGNNKAEANVKFETYGNKFGELSSKLSFTTDVNGYIAGIFLNNALGTNGVANADMVFLSDHFYFGKPGYGSRQIVAPVSTVAFGAILGIDGSIIATGSIIASHLAVTTLSAISANLGYIQAGTIDIVGPNGSISFWD